MKYMEPFVDALITNVGDREVPNKLDVVLEGGALNGAYQAGALCYLRALEKAGKTEIKRISGVSCGALVGAVFLALDLDSLEEFYNRLINSLLSVGSFSSLQSCVDDFVSRVDDAKVKSLTGRLFVSYVDLETQKRVVVSEYNSKQELADILVKSSFLPGFIDGRMTTADNCIDGGVPYIFPNDSEKRRDSSYKTLYLKLTSLSIFKNAISTRGELNMARWAIEGIQKTHDLLKQRKANEIASIVEDWSRIDVIKFTLMSLVWWLVSYSVYVLTWLYDDCVPPCFKEHKATLRVKSLCGEIWSDYICRMLN